MKALLLNYIDRHDELKQLGDEETASLKKSMHSLFLFFELSHLGHYENEQFEEYLLSKLLLSLLNNLHKAYKYLLKPFDCIRVQNLLISISQYSLSNVQQIHEI